MIVTTLGKRVSGGVLFVAALLCYTTDAAFDGDDDTREIHTSNSDLCKYLYGRKNFLEFNERCDTASPLVVGPFAGRASKDPSNFDDTVEYDVSPKLKAILARHHHQNKLDNFESDSDRAPLSSATNLPYLIDLLKISHFWQTLEEKEDPSIMSENSEARYIIPKYDNMREEPLLSKNPFVRAFGGVRGAIGSKNRRDNEENHPLYLI
ncbi:uncharacterized protein LOC120346634 [Styela clava]|uniref:uncharacterized protein LOC120346634 n=1 Tax=Styela clava TaxID=7725 RepID=UPI00193ABCF1|nr:uncharacterized protein LOC120346634 [Styela clava]